MVPSGSILSDFGEPLTISLSAIKHQNVFTVSNCLGHDQIDKNNNKKFPSTLAILCIVLACQHSKVNMISILL